LLDRIEASLTQDLPLLDAGKQPAPVPLNALELAALARLRAYLELQLGAPALAEAVRQLARRDALLEEMRARLHKGHVLLSRPDGFTLGEEWVSDMEKYTRVDRPGGPLLLDSDLQRVASADEELRAGRTAETLHRAVELVATETEAHEARHALDTAPPPAPAPLSTLLSEQDVRFVQLANLELRAYLAELHLGSMPACVTLGNLARKVHGSAVRQTPHFFAAYVLLQRLADRQPSGEGDPVADLERLCARPDAELRARAADLWRALYGTELAAMSRGAPDRR
jgi:hypothetical protein